MKCCSKAPTSSGRQNLWITDGTPAGTSEVFSVVIPNLTPTALTTFFTGPSVTGVSSPQTGQDLKAGAFVTINLALDEVAKVTGTPKLLLNDGGSASYLSGSNTATLTFKYTVALGQNIADLKVTSASLNGWQRDRLRRPRCGFFWRLGADLGIVIDTKAPTISSITPTPTSGGTVGLGGTVAIDVHLSEAAVVSGTPTLRLNDGGTAFYVPGGSSNPAGGVLEFDYTVGSGQNTPDLTISSLSSLLGGASITDSAGNAVNPTLPASKNLHLTIDSIRPSVTSATATPGGVASGGTATITLKMSQPVSVGGSGPVLDLNDGGSATLCQRRRHHLADLPLRSGRRGNRRPEDHRHRERLHGHRFGRQRVVAEPVGRPQDHGQHRFLEDRQERHLRRRLELDGDLSADLRPGSRYRRGRHLHGERNFRRDGRSARHRQQDRDASGHQRGHVHGDEGYRPGRQSRHRRRAERRDFFVPGGTFHNSGSLKAATGGDIVLGGTVANGSAGVILASGAGAHVDLDGATISGGIVKAVSHGVLNVTGGTIGSGTLV